MYATNTINNIKQCVKLESRPSKLNAKTFITLFIEPTGYFLCADAEQFLIYPGVKLKR